MLCLPQRQAALAGGDDDGKGGLDGGQVRNLFVIILRRAMLACARIGDLDVARVYCSSGADRAPLSHLRRPSRMKRSDKDQPLIDDIRLLGRILGDVIREQEGVEAYELV